MKKLMLLFSGLFFTVMMQAITIVSTAGGLATAITTAGGDINTVTNLTVTGTIDQRDFETMKSSMPALININLSGVSVTAYDAYPANAVPDYAFSGNLIITSVSLPSSVTSIGSSALKGCNGLTSVTIPSSVSSIGNDAFAFCIGLTSVTIPSSVTSIGSYAFCKCSSLTSVAIPSSVTSIENNTFKSCSSLTSVTIPSSVTSIGSYAFYSCSGLTSISIPSSVTSIGTSAFESCSGLSSVIIPASSIGDYAFAYCIGLTSISIPASVTSIGSWAFDGCSGLTSISIPASVTSIGSGAFYNCSGLTSVYAYASSPVNLSSSSDVFSGINNTTTCILHVPVSATTAYQEAVKWSTFTNIVADISTITNLTVVSTAGGLATAIAAAGGSLNTVTNLTVTGIIDQRDFETMKSSMPALINIDLSGVTVAAYTTYYPPNTVPNNAFSTNVIITSVILPSSVTSIDNYAFGSCDGLTSVTIPSSVTYIGDNAFDSCFGLTSVAIPSSVTSIADYTFRLCSGLTSFTIPSSVTSIGSSAFESCDGLTSVTIPSSVTFIGSYALAGCTGLTSVYAWSATPVDLTASTNVFSVPTSTCVLHVPVNAKAAYEAANLWSDFTNITADLLIPTLTTQAVTSIGTTTATGNGNITSLGVPNPTQYGVVWSTSTNPDVTLLTKTTQGAATAIGAFTSAIDGLSANTKYYVRTYATFSQGTYYGNEVSFVTSIAAGLFDVQANALSFYPNPATDGFAIQAGEKLTTVSIYNLSGSLILSQQIIGESYINISSLQQGVYVVKANGLVGRLVKK